MRRQVGNSLRSGPFEGCYHYSWIAWRYSIMHSPEFLQKWSSFHNQHPGCSESRSAALTWRPSPQFYSNWQCLTLLEHPWDRWELPTGDVRSRDLKWGVLLAPECQEWFCRYRLIDYPDYPLPAQCHVANWHWRFGHWTVLLSVCACCKAILWLNNLWLWKTLVTKPLLLRFSASFN